MTEQEAITMRERLSRFNSLTNEKERLERHAKLRHTPGMTVRFNDGQGNAELMVASADTEMVRLLVAEAKRIVDTRLREVVEELAKL